MAFWVRASVGVKGDADCEGEGAGDARPFFPEGLISVLTMGDGV